MTANTADRPRIEVPPALLGAVMRAFDPVCVVLFGSRARGDAGSDSDWDLLVVVDDDTPPERLRLRYAYEAITGTGIAADVVPVRESRFRERSRVVNTLSSWAAEEGVVVYTRG